MNENENIYNEERNQAILQKDDSLKRLENSFWNHIELQEYKKSNLLAHWIKDFANYHDNEKIFDTHKLKRYKRGDIIKVNLGFNVGREIGGLHYCVVINKSDNLSYGTLNVIPLSSIKPDKEYSNFDVKLGNELYTLLREKFDKKLEMLKTELLKLSKQKLQTEDAIKFSLEISNELNYLQKLVQEIKKMKQGTVARITQITTISKQRIYNPKTKADILSGIKLSNNSMDLIDDKIIKMFTKKIK